MRSICTVLASVFCLSAATVTTAQEVTDSVSGPIEAALEYALEHDDEWANWRQDPASLMLDVEAESGDLWEDNPVGHSPAASAALARVAAQIGASTGTLAPLLTCPPPGAVPTPQEFETWGCKLNPPRPRLRIIQVSRPVREGDTMRVGIMGIVQTFAREGEPSGMAGKARSVILVKGSQGRWRAVRFGRLVTRGHF